MNTVNGVSLNVINTQPILKQVKVVTNTYQVSDIWNTIQGEGPHTGRPATFIRLGGCNLRCAACDTDYTTGVEDMTLDKIKELVVGLTAPKISTGNLFVVTGGEPFRQSIGQLITMLMHVNGAHNHVQIETNGTLAPLDDDIIPWYGNMSVVVSPKTAEIEETFKLGGICPVYYKYILDHQHVNPVNGLPLNTMGMGNTVWYPSEYINRHNIFVQPLDVQATNNAEDVMQEMNVQACIQSAMKFGYRLSLQTHKQLGLK